MSRPTQLPVECTCGLGGAVATVTTSTIFKAGGDRHEHGLTLDNIVLVHGGFVDGSGWQAVYTLLKEDGYNVSIVQNPTLSLEGDGKPPGRSSTRRTGR